MLRLEASHGVLFLLLLTVAADSSISNFLKIIYDFFLYGTFVQCKTFFTKWYKDSILIHLFSFKWVALVLV